MSACATLQRSLGLERLALTTDAAKRVALRALGQVREVLDEQQRTLPWLIDNGNPVDLATQALEQLPVLGLTRRAGLASPHVNAGGSRFGLLRVLGHPDSGAWDCSQPL